MNTKIEKILSMVQKEEYKIALEECDSFVSENMNLFMENLTVNTATDFVGSVLLYGKICALYKKPWKCIPKMDSALGALRFLEDFMSDRNVLSETFHSVAEIYASSGFLPEAAKYYYKEACYANAGETFEKALAEMFFYEARFGKEIKYDLSLLKGKISDDEVKEIKKSSVAEAENMILTDPVENTDSFLAARYEVEDAVDLALEKSSDDTTPFCQKYWCEKKRILKERFSIEWRSPAEMNPNIRFY